MGRKIGEAEEIRHASDYDDFYIASKEETERQIAVAGEFIELVEKYCMEHNITDWGKIKTEVKDALGDFVWKETKRRPMIMPIIMEV